MTAQSLCFWSAIPCGYLALGSVFIEADWAVCLFGALFFLLLAGAVALEPDPVEGFADSELGKRGQ